MTVAISLAAINLIKSFEGCPPNPEWPGGDSGITLGYGCDIGADPSSLSPWENVLTADDYRKLEAVRGLTGQEARNALPTVNAIIIKKADAESIFETYTLVNEIAKTLKAFPGSGQLPPDSLGALVSVVYNRGTSMDGERRTEMRMCRDAIAAGQDQWPEVVVQIAKMVRLWPGEPTASNLSGRRLAEAALFARGLRGIGLMPDALIKGDTGEQVRSLQKTLNDKANLNLSADGKFGTGTMVGVWHYQHSANVPDTGVADAATRRDIGGAASPAP